ncbi:MAG: hypothetical protein WCQ23_06320 [Candidatus Methanomethylophilaceae archaeon]|jgi:hypothetical protein
MHARTDSELTRLLIPLAGKHKYDSINARFKNTRDLSASWRIKFNSMDLTISDYLDDAPDEVLLEFCESMIMAANGKKIPPMPVYKEWVTRDRFVYEKRKLFLKRSKNLSRSEQGTTYNLIDSVNRLLDSGLIVPSDIDNSLFSWTDRPNYRKVGYCSPLVRLVAISSALDSPNVPENVLDYVVYHEILHLRQGYRPFQRSHDAQFRAMERLYPDKKECDRFLMDLKKLN